MKQQPQGTSPVSKVGNSTSQRARKKLGGPLTPEQRQQKQEKFLAAFSETANVKHSCKVAGINRQTFYNWRDQDEAFQAKLPEVYEEANDTLEYAAHDRAVNGVDSYVVSQGKLVYGPDGNPLVERKHSDTLLITLLKARMPMKYRDKQQLELTGTNGGPVQFQHLQGLTDQELDTLEQIAQQAQERGQASGK